MQNPAPTAKADPDQAWKALSVVNDWIRHAESKVGVVLAFGGVSAGVLYNLVKNQSDSGWFLNVMIVLCAAFIILLAICAAMALVPRNLKRGVQGMINPLFFGDIAKKYGENGLNYDDVLHALTGDSDELTKHIARQIYDNAVVAHLKFKWTNLAIYALFAALLTLAIVASVVGMEGV